MSETILVTGGAGYIGSHTVVQLLEQGNKVVVFDNLCNASEEALVRIEEIAGKAPVFIQGDLNDESCLNQVFQDYPISAVIHFAGLKAVGESVAKPLKYYQNNVQGTVTLCRVMAAYNVKRLVFSSSATVYGDPGRLPYVESMPMGKPTNPYGQSKLMVELILDDLYQADKAWQICVLRYFNPIGAHPSGLIGEDPNDIPNNLMPFITQVAVGRRPELSIFGNDYDTVDGTGVRDYIHVQDLADGHLKALTHMSKDQGLSVFNLGTGKGISVLQMVNAFEKASEREIKYTVCPRRDGDLGEYYADAKHAEQELGWKAKYGLDDMCTDSWRWQSRNPNGYNK